MENEEYQKGIESAKVYIQKHGYNRIDKLLYNYTLAKLDKNFIRGFSDYVKQSKNQQQGGLMNEKLLREAIRTALNEVKTETLKNDESKFLPQDKEHLSNNKKLLNEELMKRWIPAKKK